LHRAWLAGLLLLTVILYRPIFSNGLLAWDDDIYIVHNTMVQQFDLGALFTTTVSGNYHPFTMLLMAVEYRLFGAHPAGYHAVSLLLHLLNTLLVFRVVLQLSRQEKAALVAALLFAIHPLRVESVAWASEQKDLLYGLFFLASWSVYLDYLSSSRRWQLAASLLLFVAALMSKAMAASLPVVLVLTDFYLRRPARASVILEKIPYFLCAVAFGVVAVAAQQAEGATDLVSLSWPQRLVIACTGFVRYLGFMAVPAGLRAFYDYPVKAGGPLPSYLYGYVAAAVALAAGTVVSLRKGRTFFFGIAVFAATVFLVLQLLPVGAAMMADRYTYLPAVGISFLAGTGFVRWQQRRPGLAAAVLSACVIVFSGVTMAQCTAWKNDTTLWTDVIEKSGGDAMTLNNRGIQYMQGGREDAAFSDFDKAIALDPGYFKSYANRGALHMGRGEYAQAVNDFTLAIARQPRYEILYNNRGRCYGLLDQPAAALADYDSALALKPAFAEARFNRGFLLMNHGDGAGAIRDFSEVIRRHPGYTEALVNRGNLLRDSSRFEEAFRDYGAAIASDPRFYKAYFNRGNAYMKQHRYDQAADDFTQALSIQPKYDKAYYNRAMSLYYLGRKEACCKDLESAAALGYSPAADALKQVCR
jgi:tetratricopeptide (TPR) repeat protein